MTSRENCKVQETSEKSPPHYDSDPPELPAADITPETTQSIFHSTPTSSVQNDSSGTDNSSANCSEVPSIPTISPSSNTDTHRNNTSSKFCHSCNCPLLSSESSDASTQTILQAQDPLLKAENYFLDLKVKELEKKLEERKKGFSLADIKDDEKLVSFYTAFPNFETLEIFLKLFRDVKVNYYEKWNVTKINRDDQIFLTLIKLRLNLKGSDLAHRFGVCASTVTNIVITWIHVIHKIVFEGLMNHTIPSRAKNRACLPSCFNCFLNCRIVLDCTEVAVQVPKSLSKQKQVYSHYKHKTTFKGLIGVAPNGVITYATALYPGSTSDKEVVQHSKISEKLDPGDLVLADKGFLISDIVPAGVSVNIPPFLDTPQFTPGQVLETRNIARARIHVERAINRVKVYDILEKIPSQLFFYSTKIWQVCTVLSNFRFPLIKETCPMLDNIKESL